MLTGPSAGDGATCRSREEFGAIIDELYGFIEQNRRAAGADRALRSRPARTGPVLLRAATPDGVREARRLPAQAHPVRCAARVPDVPAAARFITETVAWFAWHRLGDPDSAMLDDEACPRTVRHLLLDRVPG